MKKSKRLLCTLIALLLVFCSLSSVMTVSALSPETNEKHCKEAFSSVTIGGKKVNLKDIAGGWGDLTLKTKKKSVKVKVKLKNGWKLKKIFYYNSKGKEVKVKNGGSVKTKYILDANLMIHARKGSHVAHLVVSIDSGRE